MNKISANIVADSISIHGDRVTTFLLTFPRFILPELNTHRMFSRNSASSRAIPFEKMVKMVEEDPFIPIAWQKDHKGMQGTEYITDENAIKCLNSMWLDGKEQAIHTAKNLYRGAYKMVADRDVDGNLLRGLVSEDIPDTGVTKQICNRLLEPYMWTTMLITGSEEGWKNFFKLRCPQYYITDNQKEPYAKSWKELLLYHSDDKYAQVIKNNQENILFKLKHNNGKAEIHMMTLAESIYDSMVNSTPKQLKPGEWHIPFGDNIQESGLHGTVWTKLISPKKKDLEFCKVKIATARCARLSYMTFDGEIDYEKDLKLYDTLLKSHHMSPFEHCCRAMTDIEYYSFIKGKVPTQRDDYGILNYEYYPYSNGKTDREGELWMGFIGENPNNGGRFGWCNNFKGFIQYRYLIENGYGK